MGGDGGCDILSSSPTFYVACDYVLFIYLNKSKYKGKKWKIVF